MTALLNAHDPDGEHRVWDAENHLRRKRKLPAMKVRSIPAADGRYSRAAEHRRAAREIARQMVSGRRVPRSLVFRSRLNVRTPRRAVQDPIGPRDLLISDQIDHHPNFPG